MANKTLSGIKKAYASKRAEVKKAFYVLKKQGFEDGKLKDQKQYTNLFKAERSAAYRLKNKDKINQKKRKKRAEAVNVENLTNVTAASDAAYKVFAGGKNSGYFSILSLLLRTGRVFYGFIDIIRSEEDGFPSKDIIKINNPYMSVSGYFKKIREIIDLIQNDTEHEYLFLSTIVTIKFSYSKNKVIVTHIFDFTEIT